MALATQCPHCSTIFRVASDQLKLRGGIVRCGACNEVFDGNASLIDLDTVQPGQAEPTAEPLSQAPSASADFDARVAAIDAADKEPIYTLDFDTTFDPFGILPKSAPPEPPEDSAQARLDLEPAPADTDATSEAGESQPSEEIVHDDSAAGQEAVPAEETGLEPAPVEDAPAVDAGPPETSRDKEPAAASLLRQQSRHESEEPAVHDTADELSPTALHAETMYVAEQAPEADEPGFVKRSRLQEQAGKTRRALMAAGLAVLVLALLAQAVTTFRNPLAALYPQLRPALAQGCALLGCRVELPAQADALTIEVGELHPLSAGTYSLTTALGNRSALAQAWPHIELVLTDENDKPVLRRVIAPPEYLPAGQDPAKGFAPRSEQPVKLYFELNQVTASGYHIAVFYP